MYVHSSIHMQMTCADPESFSKWVQLLLSVFLVEYGIEGPNTTISGPSSAASETPFKWRFAGGSMVAQHRKLARKLCGFTGDPDQYCKESILCFYRVGGSGPLPPIWIRTWMI